MNAPKTITFAKMTGQEFAEGWKHFCSCIDFGDSALDAEAIRFMNEAPAAIVAALDKAQAQTSEG